MSELAEMLPALLVAIPILLAAVPIVLGLRFERTGWSVAAMTTTALTAARDGVVARGKAEANDKTMVDALGPACDALDAAVDA